MPRAGFEPTIPVFERSKRVRASDGAATGTGFFLPVPLHYSLFLCHVLPCRILSSATDVWHTQPLIQWVPEALSLGVRRPGREADNSPPSSVVVKEGVELYLHTPNTPSRRGAQLRKHRDKFVVLLLCVILIYELEKFRRIFTERKI